MFYSNDNSHSHDHSNLTNDDNNNNNNNCNNYDYYISCVGNCNISALAYQYHGGNLFLQLPSH